MPYSEFTPGNAGLTLPEFQSNLMQRAQAMRVQQEQLQMEKQRLAASLTLNNEQVQAQRLQTAEWQGRKNVRDAEADAAIKNAQARAAIATHTLKSHERDSLLAQQAVDDSDRFEAALQAAPTPEEADLLLGQRASRYNHVFKNPLFSADFAAHLGRIADITEGKRHHFVAESNAAASDLRPLLDPDSAVLFQEAKRSPGYRAALRNADFAARAKEVENALATRAREPVKLYGADAVQDLLLRDDRNQPGLSAAAVPSSLTVTDGASPSASVRAQPSASSAATAAPGQESADPDSEASALIDGSAPRDAEDGVEEPDEDAASSSGSTAPASGQRTPARPNSSPPAPSRGTKGAQTTPPSNAGSSPTKPGSFSAAEVQHFADLARRDLAQLSISDEAAAQIAKTEAFRKDIYLDQAQNPTIGYGHKLTLPEQKQYAGGITREQALALFKKDLAVYEDEVRRSVKVPLNRFEYDALVSFAFNAGGGALRKMIATAGLNDGNFVNVPEAMAAYKNIRDAKTKQLQPSRGLVNRRWEEGWLWHGIRDPYSYGFQKPYP
jgi:lysozyme